MPFACNSLAMPRVVVIGDRQKRHEAKGCLANGALQRGLRAGRIGRGIARDALRRKAHLLFRSPGRSF